MAAREPKRRQLIFPPPSNGRTYQYTAHWMKLPARPLSDSGSTRQRAIAHERGLAVGYVCEPGRREPRLDLLADFT